MNTDEILENLRFELAQVEACWNAYNDGGARLHALELAKHYKALEQALARGAALPAEWTR